MKKLISGLLVGAMLASVNIPAMASSTYREFYVSPNGSDSNAGTKSAPFATLAAAQKAVRNVNQSMTGDIVVNIEEGTYYIDEMLDLGVLDSGYNGHRVIWKGVGEAPVISGGTKVSGFGDSDGDGIYTANLSDYGINYVYQLSVNGLRRHMAKSSTLVYGQKGADGSYYYNAGINVDGDTADIVVDKGAAGYGAEGTYPDREGIYVSKKDLGKYDNAEDMMFAWNRGFYSNFIPVEKIIDDPNNSSQLIAIMSYGWYDSLVESVDENDKSTQSSTAPYADRGFSIVNAYELLDEPGEFYFNKGTKELHYIPVAGENMSTATVVVPKHETLVCIDGDDVGDKKAKNITFTNIHFTDTEWDISHGFRIGQSYDTSGNGQSGMAPSAVLVMRGDGIEFTDNIFSNTGANAINYYNAVSNSKIEGNAFYDIGVSAIVSGGFAHKYNQLTPDKLEVKEDTKTYIFEANQSLTVPSEYANDPIDLVSDPTTKVTVSSNYAANIGPVQVPGSSVHSQHHWYYKNSAAAISYPGVATPDDGVWTRPGSYHKTNVTWYYNTIWAGSATVRNSGNDGFKGAWVSNKTLEGDAQASYVMFEFLRPYTISEIGFSLDTTAVDDVTHAKSIYIHASNDKDFKNYELIGRQNWSYANDAMNSKTSSDSTNKYKYVRVIKQNATEPLMLSRIWLASRDRKPYVKNERCSNITISNNLIERAGVSANHAVGIIVTSGDNYTITHNEVHNVGYSGTSIGYSWNDVQTCSNMTVQYNYTYNTCRTSHDGGGMYQLGPQNGSVYSHNYLDTLNQSSHGFYTDNGSSFYTINNNYVENSMATLSPYVGTGVQWSDGCHQYKLSDGTLLHRKEIKTTTTDEEGKTTTTTTYEYYYATGEDNKDHGSQYTGGEQKRVPARSAIHDCTFHTNFGTQTFCADAGKEFNDYEVPNRELVGLPSEEAYATVAYAGLEDNYEYLRNLIPENKDNLYETGTYMKSAYDYDISKGAWTGNMRTGIRDSMAMELKHVLENGTFGDGLGMYPTEYKYKISNMISYIDNEGNEDDITRWSLVQSLRKDLKDNVRRYSIDETIELCEELIASAKIDGSKDSYPADAVETAKTSLANVKTMSESSPSTEYQKLIAAEDVYNTLLATKYTADIIDVVAVGADDVKIDSVEQTVTIYMPYGKSLTADEIDVIVDESSLLVKSILGEQDLSAGIKVPVFCKGNGKFRIWTIKAVNSAQKSATTLGANDWTTTPDGFNRVSYGKGYTVLGGSLYAYTSTKHADNNAVTINFNPMTPNDTKSMTFLFGVKPGEGFDYGNMNTENGRVELDILGTTATLYKVADGARTEITRKTLPINWNEDNTLAYEMTDSSITVTLNGTSISGPISGDYGRYAGIYAPNVNVKVY